jgi:hypothetical protein
MDKLLLITLFLFSVGSQAKDIERINLLLCAVNSKFSIEVRGAFERHYESYHFCYYKDKRPVVVKFYGSPSVKSEHYIYSILTKDQVDLLLKTHSIALELNLKDDTQGLDGSTWTFESILYQELKLKIWSPSFKSEVRGYKGLLSLRDAMENYAEQTHNKSLKRD